jgi:hypothetical protein
MEVQYTDVPLKNDEDSEIIRYLLGESMAPEAVERIEQRYIFDNRYFSHLQALEDRLIADFLAGRLGEDQKALFEKNFLSSSHRRRRVEVQRGMRDFLSTARSAATETAATRERHPGPRLVMLAAAAVLLGCIGLTTAVIRQRSEIARLQARLAAEAPAAPAARPQQALAFLLLPGMRRNEPGNRVSSQGAEIVHLQLSLPSAAQPYNSFTASLELPAGAPVWQQYGLRPGTADGRPVVDLRLPASLIPRGEYVVKVNAEAAGGKPEPLPSYVFRVD